jgi:AraC family transcriptional regulator
MHITYEKRLLRVLDYVYDNLDGDLSLDALADVAALSRFHFHRVFAGVTGETVAQFTRRVRLARAASELVMGTAAFSQVSQTCGYPNSRSFARAFHVHYGVTPSAFRARGIPLPALRLNENGEYEMYAIEIKDVPARDIAGFAHTGDYMNIGRVFEKAGTSVIAQKGPSAMGPMIGVYYDDPDAVALTELRSFAGVVLAENTSVAAPLEVKSLLGGKYAVLEHVGPYPGLHKAYKYLFGEWLATSGEVPRDQPPFEFYVNNPADTAPEDLITLIHVALQ